MPAIWNHLKKIAFAIRNGKSSTVKSESAQPLADETQAGNLTTATEPRIIAQKKKASKAHLSDFTIF